MAKFNYVKWVTDHKYENPINEQITQYGCCDSGALNYSPSFPNNPDPNIQCDNCMCMDMMGNTGNNYPGNSGCGGGTTFNVSGSAMTGSSTTGSMMSGSMTGSITGSPNTSSMNPAAPAAQPNTSNNTTTLVPRQAKPRQANQKQKDFNKGRTNLKQVKRDIKEDKLKLKDIILKTLEKEGGAAGLKALAKASKTSKKDLEKDLDDMGGVKQHKHGDYISTPLTEVKDHIFELVTEKLCKKGKAYIAKRKRAGEKSSAYLSGRAVKVCKGQMKG